jgi:hypothetical protein
MAIKKMETAAADTKAMLKLVDQAESGLAKVEKALQDLKAITSQMPRTFKQDVFGGNINNLANPKEYAIWVNIENFKDMYNLSREMKDTKSSMARLKQLVASYK